MNMSQPIVVPLTSIGVLPDRDVKKVAERKAKRRGLSVSEYVSRLILEDEKDPWGPVPQEVWEEWDQAVAAFEEEDRQQPRPRFSSGAEFVAYLRRKS